MKTISECYQRNSVKFEVSESMSGYYRLILREVNNANNSILLIDDAACEDYYDEDTAIDMFEQYIDEEFNDKYLNVINRGVGEFGYFLPDAPKDCGCYDINELECQCENLIFAEVSEDIYDQCDLHQSGCSQYYTYYDHNCSGEIWSYDMYEDFFEVDEDWEPDFGHAVKGYELESECHYAFVFDRVINDDAKVVGLYDYWDEE